MPSAFDTFAADAIREAFDLRGCAAIYTSPSGVPTPCTVILDRRDASVRPDDGTPPAGQATIEVMACEIAHPANGGSFVVDGVTYTVANRPARKDSIGLVWTMWVE